MVQQKVEHCPNTPRDRNMNFILDMTKVHGKCTHRLAKAYPLYKDLQIPTEEDLLECAEAELLDEGYSYIPVVIDRKATEEAHCLALYIHDYSPDPFRCQIILSPKLLNFSFGTTREVLRHELRHHIDRLKAFEAYDEATEGELVK